jgi:hypothetical protein
LGEQPKFLPAIFREQRKIALGEQPNALLLVKDFYKKMIAKSGIFTWKKAGSRGAFCTRLPAF